MKNIYKDDINCKSKRDNISCMLRFDQIILPLDKLLLIRKQFSANKLCHLHLETNAG